MEGLVERPARAAEALGEDVDRNLVQCQRGKDLSLVGSKGGGDGVGDRAKEIGVLD